jgi:hypothetical protein
MENLPNNDKKGELSDAQKRVQEIAKECGLKRII